MPPKATADGLWPRFVAMGARSFLIALLLECSALRFHSSPCAGENVADRRAEIGECGVAEGHCASAHCSRPNASSRNFRTPALQYDPYLGDFFDLTCVGNTFYGTFCASNADNGTNALFSNVSFLRDYTGTPGTSSFKLTNSSGSQVSASIDPFFFSYSVSAIVSAGSVYNVSSGRTDTNDVVLSGGSMFVLSAGIADQLT